MNEKQHLAVVVVYATAMAWVESAAVLYLRTLTGRLQPYAPSPLTLTPETTLASVEAVRELATLIMLVTVGVLAGRNWRSRLAFTMVAFGMWDIFYYVFLALIGPWPKSILDWDVLFLLPLPWWGPVLAPVAISVLLILSGSLVGLYDRPERPLWPRAWSILASLIGAGIELYVFMEDAIRALTQGAGTKALGALLPAQFDWLLFLAALILMAIPLIDIARQLGRR